MSERDARGVRLERLVVAEDLARRGRRHGRTHERVAEAVLRDLVLELGPVPEVGRRDVPQVVLEQALARGRAAVELVRRVRARLARVLGSVLARHVARRLDRGVVDRLEDLEVELARLGRVEGEAECHEGVGEALHTDADGAVAHVAVLGLLDRVVVDVDDAVEVVGDDLGDVVELLEVVLAVLDEGREGDRREVAHGAARGRRSSARALLLELE